jgi:hypothetical protein
MYMAILQINKFDIADPMTLTWDIYDLDSEDGAGRNQEGLMFRDRVAVKRKLNCTWPPMDDHEMSKLLKAMSDVFFTIRYPDAYDGTYREGEFYVGDRSTPMYMWNAEKGKYLWQGLSANFIER